MSSFPDLRRTFDDAIKLSRDDIVESVKAHYKGKEAEQTSIFQMSEENQFVAAVGAVVSKYESGAEFTTVKTAKALDAWAREVGEIQSAQMQLARADVMSKVRIRQCI